MKLILERIASDVESTLGKLYLEDVDGNGRAFLCYVCEDEFRKEKVPGETRIPAGKYRLVLKRIGDSRFDAPYIQKFGRAFHKGMIQLLDVPGFAEILIHVGNTEGDTAGCLLIGNGWARDGQGHYMVTQSASAYRRIYPMIAEAIPCEIVTLAIADLDGRGGEAA
ncbi:DUF5675 family protein [Parvibaculum sp.]|uniref:DUF5675 family protein n=1 Tax=Parvibaculum sp. TaxID=2024848 RepID=UPI00391D075C